MVIEFAYFAGFFFRLVVGTLRKTSYFEYRRDDTQQPEREWQRRGGEFCPNNLLGKYLFQSLIVDA